MRLKYWGPYRILINGEDTITGVACNSPSVEVERSLRLYEGYAYNDQWVPIKLQSGEEVHGRMFVFSGNNPERWLTDEPVEGDP
jgi:hypothetical protein